MPRIKWQRLAVVLIASLVVLIAVACGGNSSSSSESNIPAASSTSPSATNPVEPGTSDEKVVVVNLSVYNCESITDIDECEAPILQIFETYGDNLDAFVNSGNLGPFSNGSLEDAAYGGLVACYYLNTQGSEDEYIDFMLSNPDLASYNRADFSPLWDEAQRSLCPDLSPNP